MNNLRINRRLQCLMLLMLVVATSGAQGARTMTAYEQARQAPSFELPATDGQTRRLSDFDGQYVLVNFWAVWCHPCRKEMPSMQRVYEELRSDGLAMLAIHVGPSLTGAKKYAEELGLSFPIVVDAEMALSQWQVRGLPTTFLLDREGKIVAGAVGEREWDSPELVRQLREYLQRP